jgi:hypothetical protein
MRKMFTVMALVVALALSTMAPAMANGKGKGHDVINKPRCEALTLFGVGGKWSNDTGMKSCTFSYEVRLVDLSVELEEQIAQYVLAGRGYPDTRVTVTQQGTLRITLDLSAVLGLTQRGNVGAPGTIDTLQPIRQLMLDLNVWWEDCRTRTLGEYLTEPVWVGFDVTVPSPDEACTLAFLSGLI